MRIPRQSAGRSIVRYLTGRPIDGYRRTDSTFTRRGSVGMPGNPNPGRWESLAGWQRLAWRLALPIAPVVLLIAWRLFPAQTRIGAYVTGVAVTSWAVFRSYRAGVDFRHRRTFTIPFGRTLAGVLGVTDVTPDKWVTVPRDFRNDEGNAVRVNLPPKLYATAELKRAVLTVASQKLGLHEPVANWHTIGLAPYVTLRPAPAPPASVGLEDVRDAMAAADERAPVLGLGPRSVVVTADFEADSPHVAISSASGGGKSVLVRQMVTHAMHHGAGVIVCDYKRSSHKWLDGLPGVVYCKDIRDIHETLLALGTETERRNMEADSGAFDAHRIILVVEEWNALATKLTKYWHSIGGKKASPAAEAISDATFMGRHVRVNVIGVAQMLTARTTGGPETRENFATRCLARYTVNAWRMLVPEIAPMPRKSRVMGRWQVCKAGEATETQVAYLTDEQAREWATSGASAPVSVLTSQEPATLPNPPRTVPAVRPTEWTLREAVERLTGPPLTLGAIRKASGRDRRFPVPINPGAPELRYQADALEAWKRTRDSIRIVRDDVA